MKERFVFDKQRFVFIPTRKNEPLIFIPEDPATPTDLVAIDVLGSVGLIIQQQEDHKVYALISAESNWIPKPLQNENEAVQVARIFNMARVLTQNDQPPHYNSLRETIEEIQEYYISMRPAVADLDMENVRKNFLDFTIANLDLIRVKDGPQKWANQLAMNTLTGFQLYKNPYTSDHQLDLLKTLVPQLRRLANEFSEPSASFINALLGKEPETKIISNETVLLEKLIQTAPPEAWAAEAARLFMLSMGNNSEKMDDVRAMFSVYKIQLRQPRVASCFIKELSDQIENTSPHKSRG